MNLYKYEKELLEQGFKFIAGTDEAGRGPMAGPLVAAAVILDPNKTILGLNDSKKISAKKRLELYDLIYQDALDVSVEIISSDVIDEINVLNATKLAMSRCIENLKNVDYCLIDAVELPLEIPHQSIIKGDLKSASIAAASIIAKVTRDNYMLELDQKYPQYFFKDHKGYVTKKHLKALELYGPISEHRKSFKPVAIYYHNS